MCDILSDRRSNLCRGDDRAALTDIWVLEGSEVFLINEVCLLEHVVENLLCLVVHRRVVRLNLVVGRDTDCLTVCTKSESRCVISLESTAERLTNLLWLYCLLECHNIVATSSEVN